MLLVFGLIMTAQLMLFVINCNLNANLHLLLNKFLCTALPYLRDTIKPIFGVEQGAYLNDKSLHDRDLDTLIVFEKPDEDSEAFN